MKKHDRSYKPNMHKAICAQCGSQCEVPFKPSNDKPVYCSECFSKKNNEGTGRRDGNRRDDRRSDRRGGERDFRKDDRQRFNAICSVCGETCSLPFNPTPGKKVYCDLCFSKKNEKENVSNSITQEQFNIINSKLNAILKSLNPNQEAEEKNETVKKEKTVKAETKKKKTSPKTSVKKIEIKKPKTKKPVAKKTVKKAIIKKTPTKAKTKKK
jgi:CxxC-x17-CxxC domain-containing protein